MESTIITALTSATVSFFLLLLKELLTEYKQTKSLAWAINTEVAEIKTQFSDQLIDEIRQNKKNRTFTRTSYTEKYTNVFDSNVVKLNCFKYEDACKVVSTYMIIRGYFDTLRTISSTFDTYLDLIRNNPKEKQEIIDGALVQYQFIEDQHNDMINAIKVTYDVLEKYKYMNFGKFLIRKFEI